MHILFDIGGTKTRLALSEDGKTIGPVLIFPTDQNYNTGLENIINQTNELLDKKSVSSISGGIAGVLNSSKTELTFANNLTNWVGQPFAKQLEEELGCSVSLENDAACGALGEAHFGAGAGHNSVIYITVGTGIGGAWIVNGKLQSGIYGFEPGHQILEPDMLLDMEQLVVNQEDKDEQEKYLAIGLYNTLLHWPAEIIVLGGGVILNKSWSTTEIKNKIAKLLKAYPKTPEVNIASLGDSAGLYGALRLMTLTK